MSITNITLLYYFHLHLPHPPPKEKFFAFNICKESMEDLYDDVGYGWDDDDKKSELGENVFTTLIILTNGPQVVVQQGTQ